jgi:CheY-like chemotaxis protein
MKILYVEDNDDNVYMLKNRLSRAGFTVVVATDGAQGVAMATSEQPDLILMDITLPDINGEEATRRLKADPATKGIPVIALTANAMNGDRENAIAAGCDDFDTKPVDMPRLLGKIRALQSIGLGPQLGLAPTVLEFCEAGMSGIGSAPRGEGRTHAAR